MSKRARDADRNAVADVLGEAYVDGQISAEERETRVTTALAAVTLRELRGLVGDLRGDAVDRLRPQLAEDPARVALEPARPSKRRLLVVGVVAVALVIGGVVGIRALLSSEATDPASSLHEDGEDEDVLAEQRGQVVHADDVELWPEHPDDGADGWSTEQQLDLGRWSLTEEALNELLEAWQAFTGPYFTSLQLFDTYAEISVPVAATSPREEIWNYGNQPGIAVLFHADNPGRNATLMDLEDIAVRALFTNVEHALNHLDVEDAVLRSITVDLDPTNDLPQVSIWVTNFYGETAWMETTLGGRIIKEWPHRP